MRYTTIIDISDIPTVYRNINTRLVYLHMVLRSGWHDVDRDLVEVSIRQLSYQLGMTVSTVRHSLLILERVGLIKRQGSMWWVKKWIVEETPTPRARTAKQQKTLESVAERKSADEAREREMEVQRIQRENLRLQGKTSFMVYYENLEKRAAAGDIEAQEAIKRHRKAYEDQVEQIKRQGQ